jgi:hypothetical protein
MGDQYQCFFGALPVHTTAVSHLSLSTASAGGFKFKVCYIPKRMSVNVNFLWWCPESTQNGEGMLIIYHTLGKSYLKGM